MNSFRILHIDLSNKTHTIDTINGERGLIGGSSLAYFLHKRYSHADKPWNAPEQPIIFAIGPLTGIFPLMSKMVSVFSSPNNEYTESYAGGRAGLALKFTSFDAIVIVGKSKTLSCLEITNEGLELKDMSFAKGLDPNVTISFTRKICSEGAGHRTIMSIGSSGEQGSALASINVDTYRHFGRMGGGAILGLKNIKVLIIHGNQTLTLPETNQYNKLYHKIFTSIVESQNDKPEEKKYSPLAGLVAQGDIHSGACAGCPIGCVHPGFIRQKLERCRKDDIELGDEPIFWLGKTLQIQSSFDILRLLEVNERYCFDVLAVATALYWATMATKVGYISEKETFYPLQFGNTKAYQQAISALAKGASTFYRSLGKGAHEAAKIYGGQEYACTLGNETIFLSSLVFGHQTRDFVWSEKEVHQIVEKIIVKQKEKGLLNSMITCLFGKKFYRENIITECLITAGYSAEFIDQLDRIQGQHWHAGRIPSVPLAKNFYTTILPKAVHPNAFVEALQIEYDKQMHALYPQ